MNIQERLTAFAMLGAGWVMWLLVLLSVIILAIILERAWYLWKTRTNALALQEALRKKLDQGDYEGAEKLLSISPSFEASIARAGISGAEGGPEVAEERIRGAKVVAKGRMERNLAFIGTVGNNAPFVGLLGTVIGIIRAFQALHESQGQVSEGLMAEVGEALVATAIGLLVALPAVAAYNFFQRVIKGRLAWSDALGHDILAALKQPKGKG
jgi:biopolymer transport protein ExbB